MVKFNINYLLITLLVLVFLSQVFIVSHYPISDNITAQIYITKKDDISSLSIK